MNIKDPDRSALSFLLTHVSVVYAACVPDGLSCETIHPAFVFTVQVTPPPHQRDSFCVRYTAAAGGAVLLAWRCCLPCCVGLP